MRMTWQSRSASLRSATSRGDANTASARTPRGRRPCHGRRMPRRSSAWFPAWRRSRPCGARCRSGASSFSNGPMSCRLRQASTAPGGARNRQPARELPSQHAAISRIVRRPPVAGRRSCRPTACASSSSSTRRSRRAHSLRSRLRRSRRPCRAARSRGPATPTHADGPRSGCDNRHPSGAFERVARRRRSRRWRGVSPTTDPRLLTSRRPCREA